MAGAVVDYALKTIGDSLINEVQFLRGVSDDVKRLEAELRLVGCFLDDADGKQTSDGLVKTWVKDVRKVAYEAEDLLESFALKMERNQPRRRGFISICISCGRLPKQLLTRHKFGNKIRSIVQRISDIDQRMQRYGIEQRTAAADGERRHADDEISIRRRVALSAPDSDVVGREEDELEIVRLLRREDENGSVISIVGMGGLGKTTLAQKVFNNTQIQNDFKCFWVDVTRHYKEEDLLEDLAVKVTNRDRGDFEKKNRDDLGTLLHKSLERVKYLIVLDDVWDSSAWTIFDKFLPKDEVGARVLITTRFNRVAETADPRTPPYRPDRLNEEKSWELFLTTCGKEIRPEFQEIGKKMVKKCEGLPLAIIALGGLLSTKKSIDQWRKLDETRIWRYEEETESFLKILALSYNDLPRHLKRCFLYFSAFPEIGVKKLIRLWIAEGFIPGDRDDITLEDQAEKYLEELDQRCLVQVLPRGRKCRIHDLLHELAIKEAEGIDFFRCPRVEFQPTAADCSSLRRLSLDTSSEEFLSRNYSTPGLRTLVGSKLQNPDIQFPLGKLPCCAPCFKTEKSISLLSGIQLIKVIDLEGAPIQVLPEQLGDLTNLRYLGLRNTKITVLPKSSKNLSRLQVLDIRGTAVENIDSGVWKIEALRAVLLPPQVELYKIDQGSLRNMRVLKEAKAGEWIVKAFAKLSNLLTLKLVDIKVSHQQELSNALPEFTKLTTLHLSGERIPGISLMLSNVRFLHTLSLSGPIQTQEYRWPESLSTLALENTCLVPDPMPSLGMLPSLQLLALGLNWYHGEMVTCHCKSFPMLETLYVNYDKDPKGWIVEDGAMPHLKSLSITSPKQLTKLPQGLRNLCKRKKLVTFLFSSQNLDFDY